jgi:hypothetical protein
MLLGGLVVLGQLHTPAWALPARPRGRSPRASSRSGTPRPPTAARLSLRCAALQAWPGPDGSSSLQDKLEQLRASPAFAALQDPGGVLAALHADPALRAAMAANPTMAQLLQPATLQAAVQAVSQSGGGSDVAGLQMADQAPADPAAALSAQRKAVMQLQSYAAQLQRARGAQQATGQPPAPHGVGPHADQAAAALQASKQHRMWAQLEARSAKLQQRSAMLGGGMGGGMGMGLSPAAAAAAAAAAITTSTEVQDDACSTAGAAGHARLAAADGGAAAAAAVRHASAFAGASPFAAKPAPRQQPAPQLPAAPARPRRHATSGSAFARPSPELDVRSIAEALPAAAAAPWLPDTPDVDRASSRTSNSSAGSTASRRGGVASSSHRIMKHHSVEQGLALPRRRSSAQLLQQLSDPLQHSAALAAASSTSPDAGRNGRGSVVAAYLAAAASAGVGDMELAATADCLESGALEVVELPVRFCGCGFVGAVCGCCLWVLTVAGAVSVGLLGQGEVSGLGTLCPALLPTLLPPHTPSPRSRPPPWPSTWHTAPAPTLSMCWRHQSRGAWIRRPPRQHAPAPPATRARAPSPRQLPSSCRTAGRRLRAGTPRSTRTRCSAWGAA